MNTRTEHDEKGHADVERVQQTPDELVLLRHSQARPPGRLYAHSCRTRPGWRPASRSRTRIQQERRRGRGRRTASPEDETRAKTGVVDGGVETETLVEHRDDD